jgi:uncharacterized protein (TIGR02246 family)
MRVWFVVVALLLSIGLGRSASAENVDEAAIRRQLERISTALAAGDAESVGAICDANAIFSGWGGELLAGRDAIERGLAEALGGPFKGAKFSMTKEGITYITADVAMHEERVVLMGFRRSDGVETGAEITGALFVWVKRGGQWLLAAFQGMIAETLP